MTVTIGFLMYVVPNLTALYYDCVMFYLVDFIYSNGMSHFYGIRAFVPNCLLVMYLLNFRCAFLVVFR